MQQVEAYEKELKRGIDGMDWSIYEDSKPWHELCWSLVLFIFVFQCFTVSTASNS